MKLDAYMSRLLHVDLTSGRVETEPLDPGVARAFVGAYGLNMKLAYDLIPPGIDPLSPQNVVILGVGPLTGTLAPASTRFSVTTKFPLSNTIGGGNAGVRTGAHLKRAGYDAVTIRGRAAEPVYLLIRDAEVELRPASELWGGDTYATTEQLWARHPESGVMAIGPAGENLCHHALAMTDKVSATGRGGLGAVMGAKNLKAVVVKGTQGVTVADPKRFMKAVNRYFERIRNYPLHQEWITLGMQRTWSGVASRAGFVRRFGTEIVPTAAADRLCGVPAYLEHKKANFACVSCPLADKEIVQIPGGEGADRVTYSSSFSSKLAPFVTTFDLSSTEEAIRCANATNRYGLDNQDLVGIMDQVLYLYEQGAIRPSDTDGVALVRNFDTAMTLIEWTACRKGLGDTMADGMDAVCHRFGVDPDESLTIKGWQAGFDPRVTGLGTMEFEMVVNPRGGHHTSGGGPAYAADSSKEKFASHANRMGAPDDAVDRILAAETGFNPGRFTRYSEDWYAVLNALGLCVRLQVNRFHSIGALAELFSSATGLEMNPQELARCGERAWNVHKAWNVREGFSRKDDRFPPKWFEPLTAPDGSELGLRHYFGQPIDRTDAESLLDDYYDERGWDTETGIPAREKLVELGLVGVAEDLEGRGIQLPREAPRAE